MKALKEKRLSLRSVLRGGLVILSLFALVFAIGCNTSSDPEPGPGPGDSNPTVAPTPYPLSITVQGTPTKPSFQGMFPDLTGVTAVVMWSNSSVPEYITGDKLIEKGFYATKPCDISGQTPAATEGFRITHKSAGSAVSGDITLPGVIPLKSLILDASSVKWYADQRPPYDKFILTGDYGWVTTSTGDIDWANLASWGTDPYLYNNSATKPIPVTEGYPAMDITKVPSDKFVKVGIGKTATTTSTDPNYIAGGGFNGGSGYVYDKTAANTIAGYYKVKTIEFNNQSEGVFIGFDDDIKYAGKGKGDEEKVKLVKAAKLKFSVTYDDDQPAHTISWDDYYSNMYYVLGGKPNDDELFFGDANIDSTTGFLKYDDEGYTWAMDMFYVPQKYGTTTYKNVFSVPLPVYTFESLEPAKESSRLYVLYSATPQDMQDLQDSTGAKLLDALNDNWTLTGVYDRNGDKQKKTIKFNAKMFNDAGASGLVNLKSDYLRDLIASASGIASGTRVTDSTPFALPLIYRDGDLIDPDDGAVVVTLYYVF